MEHTHKATCSARLSYILREEMKLSAGLMNRLKWKQGILVNGKPEHTDYPVQEGDVVTVLLDEPVPEYPAEDGHLEIIYEDESLLAVDKPTGMLIHPSRKRLQGTLANLVAGYYQKTGQSCAFHPITRLDRDTFGITLLAKNSHIHALMQTVSLQKTYHALTLGWMDADTGSICAPIARRPLPSLLRYVDETGKPSHTQFRVLERGRVCKLALRPITGRTHQLRVHCAYAGHPILGDPQYASEESKALSQLLGLESQLLCAKELEFIHPITGETMHLVSHMDVPDLKEKIPNIPY